MNKTFKIIAAAVAVMMIAVFSGCAPKKTAPTSTPAPTPSPKAEATLSPELMADAVNITIEIQDGGKIKAELYPNVAPITVANFVKLANEHFYDGLIFHRVIEGFMIQGGGYDTNNKTKEAASIKGEFASNGVENNLKHTRGVLSMARTRVPDSASSQFFIMHKDAASLDGEYAAFGKVTEGMDIVDKIAAVNTDRINGMDDWPVTPQVIKTITVDE
jgi:peptidyl-prolyl cis-trans isomerase B (cyclophilin B)